jgi:hypothetical protein
MTGNPPEEPEQYGTPSRAIQGEWVRSKGEKKIADYFEESGIRYQYEIEARSRNSGHWRLFAKPDFYLPEYDLYVEFWGLAGTSEKYDNNIKEKAAKYHDNGIRFVSIFPENLGDLDASFKAKFRDVMGYPLPPSSTSTAKYCRRCGAAVSPPGKYCVRCGSTIH